MLTTILAAAVVLGVLIFVHELGHFLTAKLVDIEVPRFSIGFGPRILGFRRGETEYVLSLLPLGGYVKMAGMEEMEDIEGGSAAAAGGEQRAKRVAGPRDFESKSLAARTLVITAGVIMNLLFAFLAFAAIGMIWGVPAVPESVIGNIVEERLPAGAESLSGVPRMARLNAIGRDTIEDFDDLTLVITTARSGPTEFRFEGIAPVTVEIPSADSGKASLIAAFEPVFTSPAVLSDIADEGPAAAAGLRDGDRVIGANDRPIASWQEFGAAIEEFVGQPVELTVARDSDTLNVTVVPEARLLDNGLRAGRIGVSGGLAELNVPRDRLGPVRAFAWGGTETVRWVGLTFDFLGGMLTGRLSPRNVGGPIMITQISGEAARAGLEQLINFMALLSVNLAVLNLLPIPVLDGGHLLFILVEAVRGRPVSLEQRIRWTKVGFILILALMTFAIGNDIVRWIGF
jgi:regulator of sigma E protease